MQKKDRLRYIFAHLTCMGKKANNPIKKKRMLLNEVMNRRYKYYSTGFDRCKSFLYSAVSL